MREDTRDNLKSTALLSVAMIVLAISITVFSWAFAYLWVFLGYARTTNNMGLMVGYTVGLLPSGFLTLMACSRVTDLLWE